MKWSKDVFCAKCGEKIDTFSNNTGEDDGFTEALVIADSRADHIKKTGCSGTDERARAWTFGPWKTDSLKCPGCGRQFTVDDIVWRNGEEESGTGYFVIAIVCESCGWELEHHDWGDLDGTDEAIREAVKAIEEQSG